MRAWLAAAYIGSIAAAAWVVTHVGTQYDPHGPHVLPVWPGIEAPSGVYVVGLTLVLRDLLHRRLSDKARRPVMFALIAVGAALSALISSAVAVASAVAFFVSESVDYGVFTLTERRFGFLRAVVASNAVALVVDSLIFLSLAFGSLDFLAGQVVGKATATGAAVVVLAVIQRRRLRIARHYAEERERACNRWAL